MGVVSKIKRVKSNFAKIITTSLSGMRLKKSTGDELFNLTCLHPNVKH